MKTIRWLITLCVLIALAAPVQAADALDWGSLSPQPGGIDDIELLAAQDNPEFYRELDFYQWLASRGETS